MEAAPSSAARPSAARPLSRERIAEAALAFIDREGLEALSMRKLGAELGVEAMSLYNHVDRKADLLDAVGDRLYREVLLAYGEPRGDWRTHARALSWAYYRAAADHPAAVSLLIAAPAGSPAAQEFDARVAQAAQMMTDDPHVGALAFTTVSDWVIGAIVQHHGLMGGGGDHGREGSGIHAEVASIEAQERFAEGLETVLAGLATRYGVG